MPDPWESLRLLADPTRARLLFLLAKGELAVGDLWFGGRTRNPWKPDSVIARNTADVVSTVVVIPRARCLTASGIASSSFMPSAVSSSTRPKTWIAKSMPSPNAIETTATMMREPIAKAMRSSRVLNPRVFMATS
mgnify:CR=1 FL=1